MLSRYVLVTSQLHDIAESIFSLHVVKPSGVHDDKYIPTSYIGAVYPDLDPDVASNVKGKFLGERGTYLKVITHDTGCRVLLKGRGSGYRGTGNVNIIIIIVDINTDQSMHLLVVGPTERSVAAAVIMCRELCTYVEHAVIRVKKEAPWIQRCNSRIFTSTPASPMYMPQMMMPPPTDGRGVVFVLMDPRLSKRSPMDMYGQDSK